VISSKDVAKHAGVSQATVSRVLNNPDSVRALKRTKVLASIQALNYQPNLIARSLVTNSTRTIAFISGSMRNNFFIDTMDSAINLANERGYRSMIFFDGAENMKDIWQTIKGLKVDGVLLSLVQLDDPLTQEIIDSSIPHMFMSRRPRQGGNYVEIDNMLAAELVTRHVIEQGHTRIACLSGELHYSTFYKRKHGFEKAMNEANLPIHPELLHDIDTNTLTGIEKVVWQLMQTTQPPTAIVCTSDAMAVACLDALLSMGCKVPEDVSLTGIDDTNISSHQAIQLTTVGHRVFKMGEIAVSNLLEMIEDETARTKTRQLVLKPELVVRKTTAKRR
jgi:LacI family transcriptional regulator